MKAKILILLLLIPQLSFSWATATLEEAEKLGVSIAMGDYNACALTVEEEIICWEFNFMYPYREMNEEFPVPKVSRPRAVSMGSLFGCVLHDLGVSCWGTNSFGKLVNPPDLTNPIALAAQNNACAIEASGVQCWGANAEHFPPLTLKNLTQIAINGNHLCGINNSGVECVSPGYGLATNGLPFPNFKYPPKNLSNPRGLSASETHACLLDDNGVQCWGQNDVGQISTPTLTRPEMVRVGGSLGEEFTCALSAEGVQCWGGKNSYGQTNVPRLNKPRGIWAGNVNICALDEEGVKCWGKHIEGEEVYVPQKKLNQVSDGLSFLYNPEEHLARLSKYFPERKADFLKNVSRLASSFAFKRGEVPSVAGPLIQNTSLLLSLIEPLVRETSSDQVQTVVLPKFESYQRILKEKLNNVAVIELNSERVTLVINACTLVLQSVKSLIADPSTKTDLEILLLELGRLQSGSELNVAKAAGSVLQSHEALLESFLQAEKTKAFGMILKKIRTLLMEKNK